MLHLIFRLHGPLCSWGDIAVGTHRGTFSMPSRSSVLGLVAAALGIERRDFEALDSLHASMGVAARLDAAGVLLRDYHTAQMPSRDRNATWSTRRDELAEPDALNTLLSTRDHLQDAAFTIALWTRDSHSAVPLEMIAHALREPRYIPYLGRRACPPALPFSPHIVDTPTLAHAFESATFPQEDARVIAWLRGRYGERDAETGALVHFDAHPHPGFTDIGEERQRDDLSSSARRSFRERVVHVARLAPQEVV